MSEQRCTACGRTGHKKSAHDVYRKPGSSRGPLRKDPPLWYAIAHDVAGGISAWYGPLHWSTALAVARAIEALSEHVESTRITKHSAVLHGASSPLPHGWQDYEPVRTARGPRINPGHPAHARAQREAA